MGSTGTFLHSKQGFRPTPPPSNGDEDGIPTVGIVIVIVLISVIIFVILYCCYRRQKKDDSLEPQPSAPLPVSAVLQGPIFSQNVSSPQGITTELDENNQNLHTIGWRIPGEGTSSQTGRSTHGNSNRSRGTYTDSRTFLPSAPTANNPGSNDSEDAPPPYPGI